jgi:hypothetical protein
LTVPRLFCWWEGLRCVIVTTTRSEGCAADRTLHIPHPAIDLLLGLVLGDAVALLDLANQLDATPPDGGEVIVSEFAPLLLNLAA